MLTKRFFIAWITSALVMFLLSYIWHGVFLTDFSRLSYPKELFLVFSAIVYLLLGFIVSKAIEVKVLEKHFKRKPIFRGAISGGVIGLALFLIATVIGVSFSTGSNTLENLLLDVIWQIVEQTMGGVSVGIVYIFVYDSSVIIED